MESAAVSTHLTICQVLIICQLECAVKLVAEGTLSVDQVLVGMAGNQDRKIRIMLPKVLNKQTRWKTTAPFQFLSANWHRDTMAYRESLSKRGGTFVRAIFAAATNIHKAAQGNGEESNGPVGVNPHTLLCT